MYAQDFAFTPAHELVKYIAQKKISPVELTEMSLHRIERLNPKLNAFLTICAEAALQAAREAEKTVMKGQALGPLHGVPISIKDLETTERIRTTKGSLVYQDWIPDRDEIVVERLRAAGAIVLGKTNTPEFGLSGTTENRLADDCRNPWDLERTSGGSSGGAAAAVAAGIHPVAQGSDAGGSIRIPSSFCGIYGLKGTQGRVPRRMADTMGRHPVNFAQIGPMTRTVKDAAVMLQVMAGPHPDAEYGTIQTPAPDFCVELKRGVKGLRMAWASDLGHAPVDREVRNKTEDAALVFEEMGASIEPAPLKVDLEKLRRTYQILNFVKAFVTYGFLLPDHEDNLMPAVREKIRQGRRYTGAEYAVALSELSLFRAYIEEFFTEFDVLLLPTVAVPAFPCGDPPQIIEGRELEEQYSFTPFNFLFNMAGNPAASLPCGFSADGLPIGLQAVGRKYEETKVLGVSAAFEQARPWAHQLPPVS